MIIIILTNDRKPNYIHRCIRDIRRDYKGVIHLMVSGDDKYVEKYTKGFIKHHVDQENLKENWKRACKGYSQCLELGKKGEGVLVVEDDTAFKKGWYKQFLSYLTFVHDKKFIISLGKAMDGSIMNPDTKVPSLQLFLYRVNLRKELGKPPIALIICWFDSHAVYYPPSMPFDDMVGYMKKFGVQQSSMHDILIGYYMFRKLYPIYLATPPLAVNIGATHTSVGPIEDRNDDFLDWDYEE
jgi:hypothetical protein